MNDDLDLSQAGAEGSIGQIHLHTGRCELNQLAMFFLDQLRQLPWQQGFFILGHDDSLSQGQRH